MSKILHTSTETVRITIPARSRSPVKVAPEAPISVAPPGNAPAQPFTNPEPSAYQQLLESIYDGLLLVSGLSGRIWDVNDRAVALFGYGRDELLQLSFVELVSGADASLMPQIRVQAASKTFVVIEAHCVRKDDSEFPAEIALHIMGTGPDQVLYLFIRDITQRIQMERELVRLSKATDSTGDGIAIIDEEGRHVYHNAALLRLLSANAADPISMGANFDWLLVHSPPALREAIANRASWSGNVDIQTQDRDRVVPTRVRVDPIRLDDDRVIGTVAIVTDITQQQRIEGQLRRALSELARSNAELEQIAYVASHDLKEPLRVISGYMELLQRRYSDRLDDQAADFVNKAIEGAGRMRDLINHILDYARLDRPSTPLAPVHAGVLLRQAQENLKSLIQERHAIVTSDLLPDILAAPARLTQVFQNLISNALHYCDRPVPRVHVRASRMGNEWVFRVSDNGIGIPEDMTDRIFILFQRLHTRDEVAGSGIGLATCKKIIERFGGTIWLEESTPGEGSTFAFSIPVAPPEPEAQAKSRPPPGIISDP